MIATWECEMSRTFNAMFKRETDIETHDCNIRLLNVSYFGSVVRFVSTNRVVELVEPLEQSLACSCGRFRSPNSILTRGCRSASSYLRCGNRCSARHWHVEEGI